jgi:hypothetical protein
MRRGKKLYTANVHYNDDVELDVRRALSLDKYEIVSKEIENGTTELTIRIWAPSTSAGFVDRLYSIEGVSRVKAVQYEGK